MAIQGDSRFGQWAQPGFGASLEQPQGQGVLPSPDASSSASSDQSNGVVPPTSGTGAPGGASNPWSNFAPGLMSQPGGSNPGSIYLAEGGEVPQDTGDAQQGDTDPFSFIQNALTYGRQKMGLPKSFFGGSDTGDASAPSFAEGGAVDTDGDQDGDQGMIPTEDQSQGQGQQQQGGQPSPQAAMAYLKGAGAMDPAQAAALERSVDPRGQLDPNVRKTMAIKAAGSPDKAFGLMQHYRQKFNAYSAFAKTAATGTPQKPADLRASAQAATQAYQHLPDGKAVSFQPTQGGMQVNVSDAGQSQQQQQTQHFAEGGVVDAEPDADYETAGAQPWAGDPTAIQGQQDAVDQGTAQDDAGGAAKGVIDAVTPKRDKTNKLQNFVLSIPQYLGWLSKDGQADSVLDKGVEATLADAAKSQGQPPQMQGQVQQGAMNPMQTGPAMQQGQQQQPQPQQPQQPQGGMNAGQRPANWPQPGQPSPGHAVTPKDPAEFGAKVGTSAAENQKSFQEGLHEIDQAYGNWAGQQKARLLARTTFRQKFLEGQQKIEESQNRNESADKRAALTGGMRLEGQKYGADKKVEGIGVQQEHGDARNATTNATKGNIAQGNREAANARTEFTQNQLNARNDTTNKPGLVGNKDKIDAAAAARGGPARMQPPQQGQQQAPAVTTRQPSATDVAYLRSNPGVAAKFDARFGAGASKRVLGQ